MNSFLQKIAKGKTGVIAACMLVMGVMMGVQGWGQTTIVNYDFNVGTTYGTLTPTLGSNISSTISSTEAFGTVGGTASGVNAFTSNATAGNAITMANSSGTNTRYYQFQLGGSALSSYSSYNIYFQAQRSGTGATTATIAYSTDGIAYTNFGTTQSSGNGSFNECIYNLSAITAINSQSTIYFRILVSGASGTGTFRIDNFQVKATLSAGVADPASFTATTSSTSQINLAATANGNGNNIAVVFNNTGTFSAPTNGSAPPVNGTSFAGGTIIYSGTAASLTNHGSLTSNTQYFYKAFSYDGSNVYSAGLATNATTAKIEPTNQVTAFAKGTVTTANIPLTWTAAATGSQAPDGYLIKLNTGTITDPVDGTDPANSIAIAGGAANVKVTPGSATAYSSFTGYTAGTTYNYKIYSYTNTGGLINFNTTSVPSLTASTLPNNATALSFTTTGVSTNTDRLFLSWTAAAGYSNANHTVLAFVKQGSSITIGTPSNAPGTYTASTILSTPGTAYENDASAFCVFNGDGTNGGSSGFNITGLVANTQYTVLILNVVDATSTYSSASTALGTTLKTEPTNHATGFTSAAGSPASSSITVSWTDAVAGAQAPTGYLVLASTGSITDPVDGTAQTDATLIKNVAAGVGTASFTSLSSNTLYNFKIYPYTNSGSNINYKTDGTVPTTNRTTAASSSATDNFRSAVTTGNWNAAGSWESSSDNNNWITSTLVPDNLAATVTIRNGNTISVVSSVTVDEVVIASGGILLVNSTSGTFNINDGTGDDITIANGGVLQVTGTDTYANTIKPTGSANINVATGGKITIGDGTAGTTGGGYGTFATSTTNITWNDASIFEWNTTGVAIASSGVTWFPNVSSTTIPIFRITVWNVATLLGGGTTAITTLNGLFEANAANSWQGTGNKTFRNGIIGTATVTQTSTGTFVVNGTTAKFGGSGTIALNAAGSLTISSTTVATLISNKVINTGTLSVSGTLDCSTNTASGSGTFLLNTGASLLTANTGGVNSAITMTTKTFTAGAKYEFNSTTAAQSTGFTGLTINTPNLITISNTFGAVTADANVTFGNTASLVINSSSILDANTRTFTFGTGGVVTVNGTIRTGNTTATGALSGSATSTIVSTNTPTLTLAGTSVVEYNGIAAQFAAARTFPNLTINNSNGVTMLGDVAVTTALALTNGALSIGANTLTANGVISRTSGVMNGTSSSVLTLAGGSAQDLAFSTVSSLSLLNVNKSGGTATLNSGASDSLNIYTGIDFTGNTGTLNLNGKIVAFKSSVTKTAYVGNVGNFFPFKLTGATNVTVERYLSARRAWRFLSAPTSGSQTINAAWQEGQTNTSYLYAANSNTKPGYGTHITGGSYTLGFDPTQNNASSLRFWSPSSGDGWSPTPPATNATQLGAHRGYALFVRGSRNIDMNQGTLAVPDVTILRSTGSLNIGNTSRSYSLVTSGNFLLFDNPFVSPVLYTDLARTQINTNYLYMWDPYLGTTGAFQVISTADGSANTLGGSYTNPATNLIIQSGQAFMVQSTGTNPQINFLESAKRTNQVIVNKENADRAVTPRFSISLQVATDTSVTTLDGASVYFGKNFSAGVDVRDANKIANYNENLGLLRNGQDLAIETRPLINVTDTLYPHLYNIKIQGYRFEMIPTAMKAAPFTAVLEDAYLQTSTPVSLKVNTVIPFTIDNNPLSYAVTRFRIVFNPKTSVAGEVSSSDEVVAVDNNGTKSVSVYPNPVTGNDIKVAFSNQLAGKYSVTLYTVRGEKVFTQIVNHTGGSALISLTMPSKPSAGLYQLQVADGKTKQVVKVVIQ